MSATVSATCREATQADVPAIRDVARDTWAHDYPTVLNREAVTDTVEEWYDADQLAADVERGDAVVLVADRRAGDDADGTDVVGFLHAVVDGNCGSILRAYAHPDDRGEGIGRSLVETALDAFRDRGCDRTEAMVLARNDPGNAFYRSLGFEHVNTDTTIIGGNGYDERIYFKYL
jgi:ribosomal protein S18 acetylase RimI-like enzyme